MLFPTIDTSYLEILKKPTLAMITTVTGTSDANIFNLGFSNYNFRKSNYTDTISTVSVIEPMIFNFYETSQDYDSDFIDYNKTVRFLPIKKMNIRVKISKISKYKPKYISL